MEWIKWDDDTAPFIIKSIYYDDYRNEVLYGRSKHGPFYQESTLSPFVQENQVERSPVCIDNNPDWTGDTQFSSELSRL